MSKEEKKEVLKTMEEALDKITNRDMTYLIGFGEGMAAAAMMPEAEDREEKELQTAQK